jgi:hypothetical protein
MGATHISGPFHVGGVLVVDANGNIDAPVTTTNLTTSGTTTLGDDVTDDTTISGDLTVDVDATVTGATILSGSATFSDVVIMGATTATSGAAAVAITGTIHEVTTTGTGDALSLVDGAEGQHLNIVYVAEGGGSDTAICTPTSLAGASTTVTFNALGDTAAMLFTAGDWHVMGGSAVVA